MIHYMPGSFDRKLISGSLLCLLLMAITPGVFAQNPIIRNQYSADPAARVFGNRIYIYPSHDILASEGHGRIGWFCMEDYHVFSSVNLTEWTDHGSIVSQTAVPWAKPDGYSMWAPDCIERNGKYYFYFPTMPADTITYGRGFRVGVAIADKPTGPFVPQAQPIKDVHGVDPNVFIDRDGQAYLYWSAGNIYGAKLQPDMLQLEGAVQTLGELPSKGLKEGPFLFERKGKYYLTYPHVEKKIERLEYAMSDHPLGPFKFTGVIMDESPTGCWTNHQSIVEFNNQWYLFYHHNDYSPRFDKARSVRADSLFFSPDGTIQKVIPSLRGVGINKAADTLQVDRYSQLGDGTTIQFIDTLNRFTGWQADFMHKGAWLQYNTVDFGEKRYKRIVINVMAAQKGRIEIHSGSATGPLLAAVQVPAGKNWKVLNSPIIQQAKGLQNLVLVSGTDAPLAVDWIRFE
ncbi:MAG TPA: family 43 glycosylhydrolase [Chitinophagaceae bacterium]|nr:family 43 glycosylhydrolase [Chitinophagaceae bacterium]